MGRDLYEIRSYHAQVQAPLDSDALWLGIPEFGTFRIPNYVEDILGITRNDVQKRYSCDVMAVLIDHNLAGIRTLDGKVILDKTSDFDVQKREFASEALHERVVA